MAQPGAPSAGMQAWCQNSSMAPRVRTSSAPAANSDTHTKIRFQFVFFFAQTIMTRQRAASPPLARAARLRAPRYRRGYEERSQADRSDRRHRQVPAQGRYAQCVQDVCDGLSERCVLRRGEAGRAEEGKAETRCTPSIHTVQRRRRGRAPNANVFPPIEASFSRRSLPRPL